jgi:hypothetical protein
MAGFIRTAGPRAVTAVEALRTPLLHLDETLLDPGRELLAAIKTADTRPGVLRSRTPAKSARADYPTLLRLQWLP